MSNRELKSVVVVVPPLAPRNERDGVVEHRRNILCGERELVEARRAVRDLVVPDAALAIADRIFKKGRGHAMRRSSRCAVTARV